MTKTTSIGEGKKLPNSNRRTFLSVPLSKSKKKKNLETIGQMSLIVPEQLWPPVQLFSSLQLHQLHDGSAILVAVLLSFEVPKETCADSSRFYFVAINALSRPIPEHNDFE